MNYRIDQSGPIQLWSRSRLPFEPKGEDLLMRNELRTALSALSARDGEGVRATLRTPAPPRGQSLDAENVLFYNVGSAAFSRSGQRAMAWEWIREEGFDSSGIGPHHHRYEIGPAPGEWQAYREVRRLATWDAVACTPLGADAKPTRLWLELVESTRWNVIATLPGGADFGIRLRLSGARSGLPGIVKPLLDGVVASLHGHDGSDQENIVRVLSSQLGVDSARIESALRASERSVLGSRRLLWPRANGVQWNPGDDACVAVELTSEPGERLSISGELVELERTL